MLVAGRQELCRARDPPQGDQAARSRLDPAARGPLEAHRREAEPAWHLVLFHGLRRGKLTALAWDEVDLDAEVIHISEQTVAISYEVHQDTPKADSVRDIKLNRDSVILLRAWREEQATEREQWTSASVPAPTEAADRVFTKEERSMYHPQFFSDHWDRLVERSGLPPIRLHDGRHEAASLALAAGVAPKVVQAMLGHAPVETIDSYQVPPARPEKAAAMKRAMKRQRRRVA
ncbi:site-specific integrase [Streptomyces sp. NPDC056159]|uniref:site-specific integrase n=1 Tax=Streptomyces sp. NPDC056159 TaxID=3155537 RepID=UPI0034277E20